MSSDSPHYAVIGGGIAGASVAYHLSERTDEPITVYEQGTLASETTYKSMALLGRQGSETVFRMKSYALDLYNEFLADARANPQFHIVGSMGVATTREGADVFRRSIDRSEGEDYDSLVTGAQRVPSEYLSGEEIHRSIIVPLLRIEAITGALYRPKNGYMLPQELALEFIARAEDNGVEVRTNTTVTDITTEDGRVTGLETDSETVEVDEVICAAGPWNPTIARMAGLEIPVKHTLAPIMKLQPSETLPHLIPHTKHYETRIYFRGCHDGTVFVGHNPNEITPFEEAAQYDPGSIDETVPESVRDQASDMIERLYPFLLDADIVDEWVGIRSKTPDGLPIVGWTSVEGFSIAAFNSSGINLAPAVGQTIARQLVEGDPTEYHDALSITRFDGFSEAR